MRTKRTVLALTIVVALLSNACKREAPAAPTPPPPPAAAAPAAPAPPAGPVAAQLHFAGRAALADNVDCFILNQVLALPASAELRDIFYRKLAKELAASAALVHPTNTVESLQPLLDDFFQVESVAGLSDQPAAAPAFVLALHLSAEQAKSWEQTLGNVLAANGVAPEKVTTDGYDGLQWKTARGGPFRWTRAGEWSVLSRGDNLAALQSTWLRGIKSGGRPTPPLETNLLSADIDWARMNPWLPVDSWPLKPAHSDITLGAKSGSLRITARLHYPDPIGWRGGPWRIPTNSIHDPIVSFTAAEDLGALLKPNKAFESLSVNPLTSQLFIWARQGMPAETLAAVPVSNATNALTPLIKQVPAAFGDAIKKEAAGEFAWAPERGRLIWRGLPFMVFPFLEPLREGTGDYLLAGLTADVPAQGRPAPDGLFAQFNTQTNLIYYDWELTGLRVGQWQGLIRVLPILPWLPSNPGNAASIQQALMRTLNPKTGVLNANSVDRWVNAAQPLILTNNTVTVITRDGPNDATFSRKSQLGLTGFELMLLSHWAAETVIPATVQSTNPFPQVLPGGPIK